MTPDERIRHERHKITTLETVREAVAYWQALGEMQPDMAADPDVQGAYGRRKAELGLGERRSKT